MKQEVKKSEKSEVKTLISQNFVGAIDEMSSEGIVKNSRQFSDKVKSSQSNFSKIKKGEGRYITLDVIYEAVNNLGLNANFVFVEDGPKSEKLLREGVVVNNNNVSGNNNKISNITPVFQAPVTGNISIAEKIVHGMPAKEKKEMKKYMENVANEILDFKKTVAYYKKKLNEKEKEIKEKDIELKEQNRRLLDTQDKLIKKMEVQK